MDLPANDYTYYFYEAIAAPVAAYHASPITPQCKNKTAYEYNIPTTVFDAYLATEGGSPGHIRKNSNGTYDVGPMQINSSNWLEIYKDLGISPLQVRFDGCKNLKAAAWYIKKVIQSSRLSVENIEQFFSVLARYHSKTPTVRERYKARLFTNYMTQISKGRFSNE